MPYAVLTGDIVESEALGAVGLESVLSEIDAATRAVLTWRDMGRTGFARRGGDSWQAAFQVPALSLRIALFIRARLRTAFKTAETRIAIAEGSGTLPDDGDTNRAHGPAFTASGRLLEALPHAFLMSHADHGPKAATVFLADHIARGWTQAQARAVAEMLPPGAGPRSDAAKRLGISRQAVDQALHAAGYPAIDAALTAWETT